MSLEFTNLDFSITGIFLVLALIGYLCKSSFDFTYHLKAYSPSENKTSLIRSLNHMAWGIIFASIIAYFLIIMFLVLGLTLKIAIPNYISLITVVMTFMWAAVAISMIAGYFMNEKQSAWTNHIKITTKNDRMIQAREIYDDDKDFFYYINTEGEWCLIRKEIVESIKWVKTKKNNSHEVTK
ncbi:hypothetical protein RE474_09125 [Methanolobus sediminis]|uniref:Uncharacterized protein n=1 Tax=Methanolobus sediminis TaxID=3072978 RepID=A0AA51UL13_9EURY|nr:hypothetical protein [Methanolobus sediminis]WMW24256.1 hypothetical protein RE474_09125 [Methanolobus sediminis]